MRKADNIETLTWHGHEVTVETWFEQCAFPWDGDGDAPDVEGVDLLVEVTLCPDSHNFKAYGSLGGVYGDRAYVRGQAAEIVQEALRGLQTELEAVAAGRDVLTAHARQALAMRLLGASAVAYASDAQFATIEARAYNDTARDMQRRGVRLTYEQADALGQGALDWLRTRLGLRVSETDAGVIGEVV